MKFQPYHMMKGRCLSICVLTLLPLSLLVNFDITPFLVYSDTLSMGTSNPIEFHFQVDLYTTGHYTMSHPESRDYLLYLLTGSNDSEWYVFDPFKFRFNE